jgi:hypothetical protein
MKKYFRRIKMILRKIKTVNNYWIILLFLIQLTAGVTQAQTQVQSATLTRGKLWMSILPNGALEYEDRFGGASNRFVNAYPGFYGHRTDITPGNTDESRIFNVAQVLLPNGTTTDVGWAYRTSRSLDEVTALKQTQLIKNYNLVDPAQPEEYITGTLRSNKMTSSNQRHMQYDLDCKAMAWGIPKYNNFILIKCKLTNTDDVTFKNFYYARSIEPYGPVSPVGGAPLYDKEYLWDATVSDDLGFIFYDDTAWPASTGILTQYTYFPGTVSGDRGNPGNIKVAGSTDKKLYAPAVYAFSFLKTGLTPNKFGKQNVYRNIYSASSAAPTPDKFPGSDPMMLYATFSDTLSTGLVNQKQPLVNWRDANKTYNAQKPGYAGSLYERNPRYVYGIGPYDIAPGQSIEWTEIWIAGEMDRNISILGDTTSTLHFVEKGLKDLKDNWSAAKSLIQNNFALTGNIAPPPTPADQPLIGNSNELQVTATSQTVNGKATSGVNISWKAVHIGYTDPITKEADFAGYKIYQSDISVEGPWRLLSTINASDVDKYLSSNVINYFQPVNVGAPYRYCVTSFDKYGNESAKTGFNYYTVTAAIFPSNDLSQVKVVPNPYRQTSGFKDTGELKRLAFVNIPASCTIKIYTVALDLVKTIEHTSGKGETTWGSNSGQDYMLTDFAMNIMPGVYIYHVESHVPGHEGENSVGKFVIIK